MVCAVGASKRNSNRPRLNGGDAKIWDLRTNRAVHELKGSDKSLEALALSPVYESAAVGFKGDAFLNLVVQVHTLLPLGEMARRLRQIETDFGRPPNATRYSSRHLDHS